MIDYLTYYYISGTVPFRSLSALTDVEAIQIMTKQYESNPANERFKYPEQHLRDRRETEQWLRKEFISKGGSPQEKYPIYMVLGACELLENYLSGYIIKIQIPLSNFHERDISFTFFDSMYSFILGQEKPAEYYLEEYHGKVFTLPEIISMLEDGLPLEGWWRNIPDGYFPFIEAHIWNHKLLKDIYDGINEPK